MIPEATIAYEVWQDELCVASSGSLSIARKYVDEYLQDGPVQFYEVISIKRPIPISG